jgi:hypothetical protein
VRPHGQCPPDLKEAWPCLAEPCHTYNFVTVGGKLECIRSDGIVVHGEQQNTRVSVLRPVLKKLELRRSSK